MDTRMLMRKSATGRCEWLAWHAALKGASLGFCLPSTRFDSRKPVGIAISVVRRAEAAAGAANVR